MPVNAVILTMLGDSDPERPMLVKFLETMGNSKLFKKNKSEYTNYCDIASQVSLTMRSHGSGGLQSM